MTKKTLSFLTILVGVLGLATAAARAQTDGSAAFRVTTLRTNQGYDPRNVMAIWVTDSSGNFVKTLKKRAATREGYLYQWIASSGRNVTDAITGATLTSQQTHDVTWNCRNAAGALVPDGVYRIMVEMTTQNGQGPVTPATHVQFTKGPAAQTVTPANLTYFSGMSLTYTPSGTPPPVTHDVAVNAISPSTATAGTTVPVQVTVANLQSTAESVTVVLRNATGNVQIGSQTVALPASGTVNVTFNWNTAGLAAGAYSLTATAGPVSGETATANNTRTIAFTLAAAPSGPADVAVTAIAPATAKQGTVVPVQVSVTNRQAAAATFSVVLSNTTSRAQIGTQSITLPGLGGAALTYAWNTTDLRAGKYTLRASAPPLPGETSTADNTRTLSFVLTPSVRDLVVQSVAVPDQPAVGDIVPVLVSMWNHGDIAESFTLTLRDSTAGSTLGSLAVTALPAGAVQDFELLWNSAGASLGRHVLRVTVPVAAGETATADNSRSVVSTVAPSGIGLDRVEAVSGLAGFCSAAAPAGGSLAVGFGSTFAVVNPGASPSVASRLRLPGLIGAIAVGGNYAYTANGNAGVHVVSIASPAAPSHLTTINTSGHAAGVAVQGTTLYVADGRSGLRIYNVSSPASPVLRGVYRTEGPALAVAVSASTAYVVDRYVGLVLLGVGNPAAPALLGTFKLGFGQSVAVSGATAYVGDEAGNLVLVNVASAAAPVESGRVTLAGPAKALLAADGVVYAAEGAAGLQILRSPVPGAPPQAAGVDTLGTASGLALIGTRVYVADGAEGLQVINAANPAAPALEGLLPGGHRVLDLAVANGRAYVAAGADGLWVYNVSTPATPVLLAQSSAAGMALRVAVSGSRLAVADGALGLHLYDVSNPSSPVSRGAYEPADMGAIRAVSLDGTTLLASDGYTVVRLNVSNLVAPVEVRRYTVPASAYVFDLDVVGTRAVIAAGGYGLIVLDTAGTALTQLGRYDSPGSAVGANLSGSRAYLADGKNGWRIVDISNPSSPQLVSSYTSVPAAGIVADNGVAHVVGGTELNAREMTRSSTAQASAQPLTQALRVVASGGFAYVAEDDAGATVVNVTELLGGGDDDEEEDDD